MDKHASILSAENKKPGLFYGYIVVALGFILLLIGYGSIGSFGIFFKPILLEFSWTRAITSGALSLNFAVQGIMVIFSGRLTDRFGPRMVVTTAGLLLALSFFLMSQISVLWQLYLFFGILGGISQGSILVSVMSTMARWFDRRRGLMVGIVSAGIAGGQLVVAPLANQLIINYGWRTSYLILGIITLGVLVVVAQFFKRDPSQIGQLPDGAGRDIQGNSGLESTGLSLREAIHTRQMRMLFIAYFCFGFFAIAVLSHIVPHATDLGISAVSAAAIVSTIGGLGIVGRIGMGSAADRIGTKRVLTIGFILTTAMLFWLPFVKEQGMFYVLAGVLGFAWGGSIAVQSPLLAESFGMKAHGAILGTIMSGGLLGSAVGPLLTGYMFDVNGNYQSAFMVLAILSLISLILTILLKPYESAGSMKTA